MSFAFNSSSSQARPALGTDVSNVLRDTSITVAIMLAVTAAVSYFTQGMIPATLGWTVGLFLATIAFMFGAFLTRTNGFGLVFLALFSGTMGLMMSPVITRYVQDPALLVILQQALGLTTLSVAGISGYALVSRKDFSYMGGMLFAGLLVLVGASLLNLFIQSPVMNLVLSGVGALLFAAYLLFDISRIIHRGETNFVSASISIYLDIINLFMHLLSLLSSGRK